MKIKYNLEFNYFKLFNQAQGISTFRKKIEKDPYKKASSYLEECWRLGKWIIVEFIVACIFKHFHAPALFTKTLFYLFAFLMGLITILLLVFFLMYLDMQKRSKRGEMTIKKDGILDVNEDGVKIGIPWRFIDYIVLQDEILCILTKLSYFYFFNEDVKEEVLSAILKYAPDIKIINQSTQNIKTTEEEENKIEEEPKKEEEDTKEKAEEEEKKD